MEGTVVFSTGSARGRSIDRPSGLDAWVPMEPLTKRDAVAVPMGAGARTCENRVQASM
jgi:hypothetical protein